MIEQIDFLTTRKSQNDAIIDYLKTHHSITQNIADEMGIKRLASRISDLRDLGHDFYVRMVKVTGRHGVTRVAEYSLLQNGAQDSVA